VQQKQNILNYYRFFISNWKILLFAILLAFFSGFGQTFLLSLYIPSILKDLSIRHTVYSAIYASATLLSGVTIIFVGKLIDRVNIKSFAVAVIIGITAANIVAGFSFNLFTLFIAIFMLRFFGQGLLSHTAMTAMGRYFSKARGKALSIAYLGFPLAEGIFPILIVLLIGAVGWRQSFLVSAISIILILLPVTLMLLRNFSSDKIVEDSSPLSKNKLKTNADQKIWRQREILRSKTFYLIAPTTFIMGFTQTALFFFQTFIAEDKGWSAEWMALNITVYAIVSFTFSIVAGPIVDKVSAKKTYPLVLIPLLTGLLILILFKGLWATSLFWLFVGISGGLNPTVSNALYAEIYGTFNLGTVRSLFTFVMIGSTALGPVVYSLLLDGGLSFSWIHLIIITIITLNVIVLLFQTSRRSEKA
jgi:MFS family permease